MLPRSRSILLLFLLLRSAVLAAQSSHGKLAPLPVEPALDWRTGYHLRAALSADGQWVAYGVYALKGRHLYNGRHYDSTGGGPFQATGEVWVANVRTGQRRSLGNGIAPVWSRDGTSLAFFSNRDGRNRLWVWQRATGQTRRVSDAIVRHYAALRGWDAIQWTPDGKQILTKLLPEGMGLEEAAADINASDETGEPFARGSTVTVYRPSPERTDNSYNQNWRRRHELGDLALVEVATGRVQRIARRVHAIRYEVSPGGEHVAWLDWDIRGIHLAVRGLASAETRVLAPRVKQPFWTARFLWSPDSRRLAYLHENRWVIVSPEAESRERDRSRDVSIPQEPVWDVFRQATYFIHEGSLHRVAADGSPPNELARIPHRRIESLIGLPHQPGRLWSPDSGRTVYALVSDSAAPQKPRAVYSIDLTTGKANPLPGSTAAGKPEQARLQATLVRQPIVYWLEDTFQPPDLWVAVPGRKAPRRLTRLNPVFEEYALGESRMIEWLSDDGVRRQGAVLLPAGYEAGKRYPLVVWVYGSDLLSANIEEFGGDRRELLLLTTRGYAVLYPDSRVSPGTPMAQIAKNVIPGINKLVDLGIADPDRLGVMGHSYGGYSTLALIVHTPRFKAAVASAGGGYNLTSAYGEMDGSGVSEGIEWAENSQGSMGGSPWEYRERYIENSPLFYLDRVQTPLLLLHGDKDQPGQSDEVYIGLRRLGKKVEYARYAGDGHGMTYFPNQVDYWKRVIGWFDRYLKGTGEAADSTQRGDRSTY